MTGTPSPSWYDLLGVPEDFDADEIRAAWRAQIVDLDPTDRRFAVLNQAAEVLLDPARRAVYDAELALTASEVEPAPVIQAEPEVAPDPAPARSAVTATGDRGPAAYAHYGERAAGLVIDQMIALTGMVFLVSGLVALFFQPQVAALLLAVGLVFGIAVPIYNRVFRQGVTGQSWGKSVTGIRLVSEKTLQPIGPGAAFVRDLLHLIDILTLYIGYLRPLWDEKRQTFADKYADTVVVKADQESATMRGPSVPGALLIGLGVLTAAVAAPALWLTFKVPESDAVVTDTRAAQAAAERAVVPILSYDATDLDASKAAAQPYLTGDYRKEYDKLFDGIIAQNAPATGTVLTADLIRSGIVRSGTDRVQVFALINQSRTNKKFTEPQIYKNWVTITMEKVDGDWLVASLDT